MNNSLLNSLPVLPVLPGLPVLEVQNLNVCFKTEWGLVKAVDNVSFNLFSGQTLGIVGESGCGKSVTSAALMRLIESPPGQVSADKLNYKQTNILQLTDGQMRQIRGNKIAMIFQDPMTSLNPVFTVGNQVSEAIAIHQKLSSQDCFNKTIDILNKVGIPDPKARYYDYPHQLSGGMRQRIMIAMALSCNPEILIADEPTTALDVTIQAQILELMKEIQKEMGMSIVMITHDLGIIAETCDHLLVMYAGQIVEQGQVQEVLSRPKHPYTIGLLRSVPQLANSAQRQERLHTIGGMVPALKDLPKGCHFQERCPYAQEKCRLQKPVLEIVPSPSDVSISDSRELGNDSHKVSCFFYKNIT